MPSAQIRIPTPITVHLDHCPECADDLKALRNLGLTAEQLERLERLYGCESLGTSSLTGLRTGPAWPTLVSPRLPWAKPCRLKRARSSIMTSACAAGSDIGETLNRVPVRVACT
jgi:hypothetical protein